MKKILIFPRKILIVGILLFTPALYIACQSRDAPEAYENIDEKFPESGEEALQWLLEGNFRFIAGKSRHLRESAKWRTRLTEQQHPFATILGCSDSRVPIELLFDQGFGDLFIIRVAGNVVGPNEKGSIAYAVAHLHTPLILVLGHEGCGAVTAAMLPDSIRRQEPVFLQELLTHIDPAVKNIDPGLPKEDRIHQGVEANVRWSIEQLKARLQPHQEYKDVLIAGAVYELDTGKVRFIK